MIRNLCKDDIFLAQKSIDATKEDAFIGKDLMDTLKSHSTTCVGMAADMIGSNKRIIAILDVDKYILMYNPEIIKFYGKEYITEEGCLCHNTRKKTKRFEKIQIRYLNEEFKMITKSFNGFSAEIIQHEIDHLNGILI